MRPNTAVPSTAPLRDSVTYESGTVEPLRYASDDASTARLSASVTGAVTGAKLRRCSAALVPLLPLLPLVPLVPFVPSVPLVPLVPFVPFVPSAPGSPAQPV